MNKTISAFIVLALLYAFELTAQIPPHINYQAVLRNTQTGEELSNQEVFIVAKFIDGGRNGEIVYQEEHHKVTTSLLGLINLQLGSGVELQGSFSAIPWVNGDIWLSIEIDAGEGLKPLGTTKFSSVPYALYAASGPEAEPNLDNDPTNEIQDIILTGNILRITDNPNSTGIDLSDFMNSSGEVQDLSLNDDILIISDNLSATPINLGIYKNEDNLDNDPTNEIQDITLTGNILRITDNPNSAGIDLGDFLNSSGGIQDLSLNDNILIISNNPEASPIDLTKYENADNLDNDPTNEIQELLLTGNLLTISNNPEADPIDLTKYENAENLDNDPTNEIQELILTGNLLTISNNPEADPIDLTKYENADNLDNDPTNEIQDLAIAGGILTISDNQNATPIDLRIYENQTLPKNHIFIGNDYEVATPSEVLGDVVLTEAGKTFIKTLHNIPISTNVPTNGQKLTYNAGANIWEPKSDSNPTGTVKYYSVDPMDFVELNYPDGSATLDRHNGLRFFNGNAPFAMLRKTPIRKIGAPVHLPHGATITEVKFLIKDTHSSGNLTFSLHRKQLTNYNTSNSLIVESTSASINGNGTVSLPASANNVVNNEIYTYRVFVHFTTYVSDDDEDDYEDVRQAVYGVVITYTE